MVTLFQTIRKRLFPRPAEISDERQRIAVQIKLKMDELSALLSQAKRYRIRVWFGTPPNQYLPSERITLASIETDDPIHYFYRR
jgi:hypothetical protein